MIKSYLPALLAITFFIIVTFFLGHTKLGGAPNTLGVQFAPSSAPNNPPGSLIPNPRTKTSDCQVQSSLPDSSCTPGAVFPNATRDQICNPGYSKSVRNVSTQEKDQVYSEYGIASHQPGEYEVDHLISLELGGSNDIANLWPEASEPRPGFHEKDLVENYLHSQVCSGKISLEQAQQEISTNWLQIYQNTPNITRYKY